MFDLVVGLGNPGLEYENTRHNIGWLFLDKHPEFKKLNWKSKFKGLWADTTINGHKVYFLKPQTYMNLSGESVQAFCQFYKIDPKKILVLHDELDLQLGFVNFKTGGGLAGHNGLKSMDQMLGTSEFGRLRLGIGRPVHGSVSDWVLGDFNQEEWIKLDKIFTKLAPALVECIQTGIQKPSQQFNKKDLTI